jgi:general nucleoside transport system permease protein
MVFTLQGLIVLFAGAMSEVALPWLASGWRFLSRARKPAVAEASHG